MKRIVLMMLVAVAVLLASCEKGTRRLATRRFTNTECKSHNNDKLIGTVYIKRLDKRSLRIYYNDAPVGCGFERMVSRAEITDDNVIYVYFISYVTDNGQDCICHIDITCEVGPLDAGQYLVNICLTGPNYEEYDRDMFIVYQEYVTIE